MTRLKFVSGCVMGVSMLMATAVLRASNTPHCDGRVQKDDRSKFAYAERGDRCEGDFQGEVGNAMRVMSLTRGRPQIDLDTIQSVDLSWPRGLADVGIHMETSGPAQYYRMDAKPPSTAKPTFKWNLDVLKQRAQIKPRIHFSDLSFTGEARRAGTDDKPTAVPIGIAAGPADSGYVMLLRVTSLVTEAYASLKDRSISGSTSVVWGEAKQIDLSSPVDAQDILPLSIPESNLGPGFYELRIRTVGRGMSSLDYRFYHD